MASRISHPPLSPEALNLVAGRFKVLSEPMRLRLLNCLQAGEQSVGALLLAAGTSQANISKHLGVLTQAGMVRRRRQGTNAFYSIADPMIFKLCDLVCSGLQKDLRQKAAHFDK